MIDEFGRLQYSKLSGEGMQQSQARRHAEPKHGTSRKRTPVTNCKMKFLIFEERKLQRLPRAAHKITKHGHVRTIRADASRIHRQTKPFGLIKINAGVIEFGKTETLRGEHTIQARRIHRTGRTVPLPWPPRQFIKLLPIAFVPSRHSLLAASSVRLQQALSFPTSMHPNYLTLLHWMPFRIPRWHRAT
jgi:hypothetical protein